MICGQDKLLDQSSVSHLFPVTKYLGLLATGMTGLYFSSQCLFIMVMFWSFWGCSWFKVIGTTS